MSALVNPYAFGGGQAFVGLGEAANATTGTRPIPYPPGTAAGQVALIYLNDFGQPGALSTAGWLASDPISGGRMYFKVLTEADLSATYTASVNANRIRVYVFAGFAGVTRLSTQGDSPDPEEGTTTKAWAGVTKSAACKAVIFATMVGGLSLPDFVSPAMDNDATVRTADPSGSNPLCQLALTYNFVPSQYTNGQAVTFGGYDSENARGFMAFELT